MTVLLYSCWILISTLLLQTEWTMSKVLPVGKMLGKFTESFTSMWTIVSVYLFVFLCLLQTLLYLLLGWRRLLVLVHDCTSARCCTTHSTPLLHFTSFLQTPCYFLSTCNEANTQVVSLLIWLRFCMSVCLSIHLLLSLQWSDRVRFSSLVTMRTWWVDMTDPLLG